jgi:hypothetical protein
VEAAMTTGLILLVFIAALITFFWIRLRRRMGMGAATTRTWAVAMAVIIVGTLALWVYQTQG